MVRTQDTNVRKVICYEHNRPGHRQLEARNQIQHKAHKSPYNKKSLSGQERRADKSLQKKKFASNPVKD